jgi:hypothetical protein
MIQFKNPQFRLDSQSKAVSLGVTAGIKIEYASSTILAELVSNLRNFTAKLDAKIGMCACLDDRLMA